MALTRLVNRVSSFAGWVDPPTFSGCTEHVRHVAHPLHLVQALRGAGVFIPGGAMLIRRLLV